MDDSNRPVSEADRALLEQYKIAIGAALGNMDTEEIRQLIREIEDEIKKRE